MNNKKYPDEKLNSKQNYKTCFMCLCSNGEWMDKGLNKMNVTDCVIDR